MNTLCLLIALAAACTALVLARSCNWDREP
jgi:hypothetical protein